MFVAVRLWHLLADGERALVQAHGRDVIALCSVQPAFARIHRCGQ